MKKRLSYRELLDLDEFDDRFEYLCLGGSFGDLTFDTRRYLNQAFYMSDEWKAARINTILRDDGCDLGVPGREIHGTIYVHHINPVTMDMLVSGDPAVIDLDNLICTSYNTHKAIHYGDANMLRLAEPVIRTPNDTCPWKGGTL